MQKLTFLLKTIALVLITFQWCNGQTTNKQAQQASTTTISKETAISVFKDLVRIEPVNCIVKTIDNKECIICLANKSGVDGKDKMFYSNPEIIYYKLTKFANSWRIETQKPVFTEEFIYCEFYKDFEVVVIKNKTYLYFLYNISPMGNAAEYYNLNFALFSLLDFQLITLDYGGDPIYNNKSKLQQIKGDFINLDKFNDKPELLFFLEGKARKCSLVYRATNSDLDINSSANYEKKWQIDNSKIKSVWDTKNNIYDEPLRTTYYDKNLFPSDKGVSDRKVENSRYIIVSLFRNNILGYDKARKKYFPIWVESCAHGCDKKLSFVKETILQITYSEADNQEILVDLSKMTYSIILK